MSIKISDILPKEIFTEIPVCLEQNGETVFDNIIIYSPTLERMESFQKDIEGAEKNEEILFVLIKHFTDIDLENKTVESLGEFQQYFSEVFDALSMELYKILTIIIKQGIKTREILAGMDEEYFKALEAQGIEEGIVMKEIKSIVKKD